MKILDWKQVGLSLIEPCRFGEVLALRAVSIPARIVADPAVATFVTLIYMAAQRRSAAHLDGAHYPHLLKRQ
jgi:hypothetical protein